MSLYDKLLNIDNKNIETKLNDAIKETYVELNGLTEKRTCMIYSSYLYENLKERHLLGHIINTKDLGSNFAHQFILMPTIEDEYYLVDLTYRQFEQKPVDLIDLYEKGYQKIDNLVWQEYLDSVLRSDTITCTLEDAFFKETSKKRK